MTCSSPARSAAPTCRAATTPPCCETLRRQGAHAARRHRRAAGPRRADLHRPRARHQPVPPRPRAGPLTMAKPTPLSGFPELLPAARAVEREVIASLSHTFELHGFANIETRAVEPLDRLAKGGEIDKEIYVLRRLQAGETAASDTGLGAALRPDGAVRALRAGARRSPGVPVPALPDPARLAGRAAAGGSLPPVHPGRRRHRRPRRAAVPPRRRGDARDGGGARRACRCRR